MNANDYQKQAITTAYTDPQHADTLMEQTIWAMGIAGESGEVIEKWKKIVAYKEGKITPEDLDELTKELGDVICYIAVLANSLGLSLDDIMQRNLDKLASRQKRGAIKGQGDNR
jgi:NTP pyrophosphatase (non-canonical NTP hydrolase)